MLKGGSPGLGAGIDATFLTSAPLPSRTKSVVQEMIDLGAAQHT